MTFTVAELAQVSDARLWPRRELSATPAPAIHHVVVDSRRAQPHALFVALPGARADGHDFLADAFAGGASAAMIATRAMAAPPRRAAGGGEPPWGSTAGGRRSIAGVASDRRRTPRSQRCPAGGRDRVQRQDHDPPHPRFDPVAARSDVRVGAQLQLRHRVAAGDPGNSRRTTGWQYLEVGIDHTGEMDLLGRLALPHYALITGIGSAHLEFLHSRRHIAAQKSRLFVYLQRGGCAFVPEAEPLLAAEHLWLPPEATLVRFGPTTTQGYEGSESLGLDGSVINWEGLQIHFPLFGNHNVTNVLAAITVASTMGVCAAAIQRGIEAVRPVPGRSQVIRGRCNHRQRRLQREPGVDGGDRALRRRGCPLAVGFCWSSAACWNWAPPARVRTPTSASRLRAWNRPRYSCSARRRRPRQRCWRPPDTLARCSAPPGNEELETAVLDSVRSGDTVLLKGSRGVALDRLVAPLQAAA